MIPAPDAAYRLTLVGGRVRVPAARAPWSFRSVATQDVAGALPPVLDADLAAGRSRVMRLVLLGLGAGLLGGVAAAWGGANTPLAALTSEALGRLGLGLAAVALALALQPVWLPLGSLGEARTRGAPIQILSCHREGLVLRVHDADLAAAIGRENGVAPVPERGRGRGPGPRDAWLAGPVSGTLALAAAAALVTAWAS